jgi:hypothetical protein
MLATINTPKDQAPFGVSLLHLILIIQGYYQNSEQKTKYIDVYRIFANEYIKRINENKTLQKCTFLMKVNFFYNKWKINKCFQYVTNKF